MARGLDTDRFLEDQGRAGTAAVGPVVQRQSVPEGQEMKSDPLDKSGYFRRAPSEIAKQAWAVARELERQELLRRRIQLWTGIALVVAVMTFFAWAFTR